MKKQEFLFKAAFFLFVLNSNYSLTAQININLQASRTTGVAPLYVFFDVTQTTGLSQGDYLNANFFWDFDNPDGKHNKAKGFVAAHVFETPGEYIVSVNVIDSEGNTATETTTINVTEFSGTTYYVSSAGNDNNAGTEEAPFASVEKGFSVLGPNTKVLFKRGDSFNMNYEAVYNVSGPAIIGAYGAGDAPVFNTTEANWGTVYFHDGTDDVRFMDIKVVGTTSDREQTVAQRALLTSDLASNILFLRCEVENVARDASGLYGNNNAVFDCYFHDYGNYSCYTRGNNLAFVGNISRRQTGNEHFYRTQGGSKQFVAFNDYDEITSAKSSIQIRGSSTDNVVVLGNRVQKPMGFNPQNDEQEEYITNCLAEDNISTNGISVTATNIVIRNNILGANVNLDVHPLVGMSDNIHIYNNIIYGDLGLMINGNGTNIILKNNCYYTTSIQKYSAAISLYDIDPGNIDIKNNLYYAPNKPDGEEIWFHFAGNSYTTFSDWLMAGVDDYSLVGNPDFVEFDYYSANYLRPSESSPLLNEGAEVPVFSDIEGNIRPYGDPINIGAYQSTVLGIGSVGKTASLLNELLIYPNPATNQLNIDVPKGLATLYSIELFNILGSKVFDQNFTGNIIQTLSVDHLPKGLYLLKIKFNNEESITRKIVIQ